MWPKVNKDLLPMKGHYFLFNAGTAPVQPFMPVYAKQLGFSSVVVGTVYTVLPITGMLSKPLFGALADRFRIQKLFFLCFQIITIVAFFSIQFVPEVPYESESKVKLVCGSETYFHVYMNDTRKQCSVVEVFKESKNNENLTCSMKCDLTSQLRTELCDSWKLSRSLCTNADIPFSTTTNNIISDDGKKLIPASEEGKSLYSGKSAPGTPIIDFIATIPMSHFENVSNYLYFRISSVKVNDESVHIPYCNKNTDTDCEINCEDKALSQLLEQKKNSKSAEVKVTSLYQFWVFFCLLAVSWIGMAVVVSVADAICFEILGERASEYGNQRLWGSVGWGILAIISGLIVDEFSKGDLKKNYTPVFYLMLILLSCDVVCSYSLRYEQTKISKNIIKDVGKLLMNIRVVLFMLWCVFIGMCTGIQWNFLFWYLEELATAQGCDTVSWIKTLQGLVSGVQCFLGELPSFFLSGWILKKIGHIHAMTLVLFVVGVRFLLYSILSNPWWCLPIELFQATFGLFYPTMASYASIVAPPGTEATVQGLVGAIFEGVGVAIGSFLGGIFFDHYGGKTCFRIFGVAAMVMFVLHSVIQYFLNRRSSNFTFEGKDFNGIARYASPNEAVSMLDDT